jgi:hypothetical protein
MPRKKAVADLAFDLSLTVKKDLDPKLQGKLWRNLLSTSFRSALGNPELDHVVTGSGGESHIEYDTKGIAITAYDSGMLTLSDSAFSKTKASEMERILNAFFKVVNRTKRRVTFRVSGRLHMRVVDRSLEKFLSENIQFKPTVKFRKALGNSRGVKSFLLKMSDNVDMVVHSPSHIDFLYSAEVASALNRKPFVMDFVTAGFKYIDSMRMYAQ